MEKNIAASMTRDIFIVLNDYIFYVAIQIIGKYLLFINCFLSIT